jgi:hypothetical protein
MNDKLKIFEDELFKSLGVPSSFLTDGQQFSTSAVAMNQAEAKMYDMQNQLQRILENEFIIGQDPEGYRIKNKSW